MSNEQLSSEWNKVVLRLARGWEKEYQGKPLHPAWVTGAFVLMREDFRSQLGKTKDDLFQEVQRMLDYKQEEADAGH
jgi:hypothetical protein